MHRYFWSIVGFLIFMGASPAQAQDDAMARYEAAMQAADEALDRDRERTASNHLDDAEAALAEMAGDHPLEQGRILVLRTGVERERQDWDDAFAHIDRAVNLLARGGAEDRELGDAQYSRGYIAYVGEQYEISEEAFCDAASLYSRSRDEADRRRLRSNGWCNLVEHWNAVRGSQETEYAWGQAFLDARVGAFPDPVLREVYPPGGWIRTLGTEIPYGAILSQSRGFVIARYDLSSSGQPENIEILVSYPGDVYDDSARDALRTGRREPFETGDLGYVTIITYVVER